MPHKWRVQIRLTKSNVEKLSKLMARWKNEAATGVTIGKPTAIVNNLLHINFDQLLKK